MAKARKDNKGRALRKGETQRSIDGKYVYTYMDTDGKRHSIYDKDLLKLRTREDKIVRDGMDGINTYVAGNASLNYVFDRYIRTKPELRNTTKSNYIYMYNHYVRDGFGRRKIVSIGYYDVIQFYQSLLDEKGIQINTLDTIHTVLHPTFQLAVIEDIIRTNPSDGVMTKIKKMPGKNKGIRHALTPEQQKAFLDYVGDNPENYRWYSLFVFLFGTGCRIGEAIGIRWDDLDFKNREININHSLVYYSAQYKEHPVCSFAVSLPKIDKGIRVIPMVDKVYDVLMEDYEFQKENGFNQTVIDGMTGFVFMNRFGGVHNPQTVNRAIARICASYSAQEEVKAARENLY